MPSYLQQSEIIRSIGGFTFHSSGSEFIPTSSNASTVAQLNISISSSLPTNIISNTTLNPFIRFTVVSGSNRPSKISDDIVIRFFSQSHIQTKYLNNPSFIKPGYVFPASRSLYITSSNSDNITFVDINYSNPTSGTDLGQIIHNALTGSPFFRKGGLSASRSSTSQLHTTTIHYTRFKGAVGTIPTIYTGSESPFNNSIVAEYTNTGSGTLNFVPRQQLHFASSSFQFRLSTDDPNSLEITQGVSSSGFTNNTKTDSTLLFFSSSGKIGAGTKDPKADFDISGSIQGEEIITKPTTGRPIKIKDSEIKFYETTQNDPNHADYGDNKERARIKATPGSFNLTFEVSGSSGYTNSVYISQSGNIGFNTNNPQSAFDARVNEAQFQRPGSRKGLKINQEGNIESFDRDINSATTGSEFVLKYSRGVEITPTFISVIFGESLASNAAAEEFFNSLPQSTQNEALEKAEGLGLLRPPQVGDILGSIRFVAESGSIGALDERSTGETAAIKAIVSDGASDGISSDLIFSVANKDGAAQQKLLLDSNDAHTLTGTLTLGGGIVISGQILSSGNTGTFIDFINSDNDIRFLNNNVQTLLSKPGVFIINPINDNVDFRVDGDSNDNLIFADASTEKVGIGTGTPSEKLTVAGNISASGGITAAAFTGSFSGTITGDATGLTGTPDISVRHITSSGNISSSGTIIANKMAIGTTLNNPTDGQLEVHGAIHVEGTGGTSNYLNFSTNASSNNNTKILARGNQLLIKNNADFGVGSIDLDGQRINLLAPVTASGDISSSGTITANSFVGTVTGDATGLTGTPDITVGNVTATGKITAQEFHTEFVSASVIFESGSTKFGDTADDTHVFSGSLDIQAGGLSGVATSPLKIEGGGGQIRFDSTNTVFRAYSFNLQTNSSFGGSGNSALFASYNFGGANPRIGIGTTSPGEKLEVVGNISASGNLTGLSGSLSVLGVGTTTPAATVQIVDGGLSGDNTLNLNNRVKFRGDGVIFWGASANFGLLNWSGNDTLIGAQTGKNLNLYANNSSKMFISASGNVGIGTASPAQLLHVYGGAATVEIESTTNESVLNFDNSVTTANIKLANGDLKTELGGSEVLRISSSGNVGIGTASPTRPLHVVGGAIIADTSLIDNPVGSNATLEVYDKAGDAKLVIHHDDGDATKTAELRFRNGGNDTYLKVPSNTNGLVIDTEAKTNAFVLDIYGKITSHITASGNISASGDGIFNNLDIDGNIKVDNATSIFADFSNRGRIDLFNSTGNNAAQVKLYGGSAGLELQRNTGVEITGDITASGNISASGKLQSTGLEFGTFTNFLNFTAGGTSNTFKYNEWKQSASGGTTISNTAGTINFDSKLNADTMVISGSSVGIGTTTPATALHVKSDSGGALSEVANFVGGGSTDDKSQITVGGNTTSALVSFGFRNTGSGFGYIANASDTEVITIDGGNERVGIGNTAPTYTLDIESDSNTTTRIKSAGTGVSSLRFENAGSGFLGAIVTDNNGLLRIDATNINLNAPISSNITASGNISASGTVLGITGSFGILGIGTTTPSYGIDIVGGGLKTTTATGNDIAYYDGSSINAYSDAAGGFKISNYSGDLSLRTMKANGDIIFQSGSTEFFRVDGGQSQIMFEKNGQWSDDARVKVGSGGDLQMYHSSNLSFIENYTGNLTIKNTTHAGDIIFQAESTSGTLHTYFTVDGGAENNKFFKPINLTGDLTASGNISASGRVYGTHFGTGNANRNALDLGTDNTMQFRINDGSRITLNQTQFRPSTDEAVALGRLGEKFSELVVKHVTASGNISASGTVIGHLVPQVPKVEYYTVTSSGLTTNTAMALPNSLTYMTSSGGYEYLEVFTDGIRLNRTIDYAEVDTSTVRYLISIPSQSIITYKSLRTV